MQNFNRLLAGLCITAELSHFFCCGIPLVFSLLGLLSNLGFMATMPGGLEEIHHFTHDLEMPIMIMSGMILLLGWAFHLIASQLDCRSTGCGHEPCKPKKKRSYTFLVIATVLFVLNISGFLLLDHPA
jgi:hypothetical protein